MTDTPSTADDSLTTTDVLQRLDLRESSRYGWLRRAIRDGKFPPPDVQQQGRGQENRWHRATIEAWEQSRFLGSKQPAIDFDALEQLEASAVLSWRDVLNLIERSPQTLRRWLQEGVFPAPDVEKLSITQVAARFNVSVSQVRHWEKAGVVQPSRQTGVPMYGAIELRQLYQVTLQKEYKTAPLIPSHRFIEGYFWSSETLEDWAKTEDVYGKIEQLDRAAVLARLQQKFSDT